VDILSLVNVCKSFKTENPELLWMHNFPFTNSKLYCIRDLNKSIAYNNRQPEKSVTAPLSISIDFYLYSGTFTIRRSLI